MYPFTEDAWLTCAVLDKLGCGLKPADPLDVQRAELREQFIAVLGHDLRTPPGAIQAGVDLLGRMGEGIALARRREYS